MNNHEVLYGINKNNYMGKIVSDGLRKPVVKQLCTRTLNMSYSQIKDVQKEFSRFIGFCILFKDIEDIESYMLIHNKEEQINFLKKKVATRLGIPQQKMEQKKNEIIEFAFENFKKNGYVFHAANSLSVMKKMTNGLYDNDVDIEQQQELLRMEEIYRKYNAKSDYSPFGHGATDIKDNKTGWFFDGLPIHSTGYANSPQWFNYLCGKSYVYFNDIPEEKRNGYESRDYKKALKAVLWLVQNESMATEDRIELIMFFKKCWKKYKDTTPCLIFVPGEEVGINEDTFFEQYLSSEGDNILFNDIVLGCVNPIKNCCCKKKISSEKLSFVDLSPILPRVEILDNEISKKYNYSVLNDNER